MNKINRQLELGLVDEARVNLAKFYNKEHKQAFYSAMRDEYYVLFPITRLSTYAEYVLAIADTDLEDEILTEVEYTEIETPFSTEIDYSGDETFVTYAEYINETIVITPEVLEVSPIEIIEGFNTVVIDVEYVAEATEQVRPYIASDVTADVEAYIRITTLPKVVTMRQARLALYQSGLLAIIEAAIADGTNEEMKIEWEYATDIRRDWPNLIALTTQLGTTKTQLDDLFRLAGSL